MLIQRFSNFRFPSRNWVPLKSPLIRKTWKYGFSTCVCFLKPSKHSNREKCSTYVGIVFGFECLFGKIGQTGNKLQSSNIVKRTLRTPIMKLKMRILQLSTLLLFRLSLFFYVPTIVNWGSQGSRKSRQKFPCFLKKLKKNYALCVRKNSEKHGNSLEFPLPWKSKIVVKNALIWYLTTSYIYSISRIFGASQYSVTRGRYGWTGHFIIPTISCDALYNKYSIGM